ncbi:cysteine dioxygenase family protein [Roseococcus sp. SDR]|uniref:cysteine dioxygenase family protein n=1 Tax=Roseococcus sp. SDR TaxID=2835532 RepID=UPI001BD169F6|nr:cysteine dioxygenase family protein [Roseococcus sp. SDR]MBS7788419.1 cysteine dioxygenase family protein [Roseococcus sp. SDR]MBV1843733.1 cysteine dioxygenase family protein [Roseococcus sp. SDR]
MNSMDVKAARTAAVAAAVGRVREIEARMGVTREALEAIKAELMNLAAQEHLFPSAEFPPPPNGEKGSNRYLLREEENNRFALYLNALNPGNETKPHDHTTWAVVVAVDGQELNKVYDRLDDGSNPERCEMRVREEIMVEPGRGICLMPEDIHSIHTTGTRPTRHLHMYGLALEKLDGRRAFDDKTGVVSYYNKNFMKPTADAKS